jgi:electron transport complex protein RnfB
MSSIIEKAIHEKPTQLALIREAECIGCTKCIQACPFDSIIGGAKQMHTVLMDLCTGCGLCVIPCPVDCIEMVDFERLTYHPNQARERFNAHKLRVERKVTGQVADNVAAKKAYIQAAIQRAKNKKID